MNIFITDENPCIAATNLDDRRINKMVVESAQLTCTNLHLYDVKFHGQYKPAWQNHPCTVWARQSSDNFEWLCLHGIYLAEAYSLSYHRRHKTLDILLECLTHTHVFPNIGLTPFANCSLFKEEDIDIVEAYRQTLNTKWARDRHRPTWNNRGKPEWYRNLGGLV